jgi:hypothetical protein
MGKSKHSGKKGGRTPEHSTKKKGGWTKPLNLDIDGALRINTHAASRR